MHRVDDHIYMVSRKELKNLGACQFREGDTVVCNKYRIRIKYGQFSRPSLLTTVYTRDSLVDLKTSKWTYYVSDFITRSIEECKGSVE